MFKDPKGNLTVGGWFTIAGSLLLLVTFMAWGFPQYKVYSARKNGEAVLAHAQYSREVAVAEARAKREASALLAEADTIRAHGIAASNRIIGQSLENNPSYLAWLWIDELKNTKNQVIYVPASMLGMPITEANRLPAKSGITWQP
jgi:regulator of protease activity HflC (stomatin/prohibitin superfamily)